MSDRSVDCSPSSPVPDFDPMEDFVPQVFSIDGRAKTTHVSGAGPGVIILAEMPGISPHLIRFARWVRDAGFRVYLPSLFGVDGATATAEEGAAVFRATCLSAEFATLASTRQSPVTQWLRGLARHVHAECGGRGVGAVGMCFTGNFALTMMLEPATRVAVMCQPSLPLTEPNAIDLSPNDATTIRHRLEHEHVAVVGYRFTGDRICRPQRMAAYAQALGPHFVAHELPDTAANPESTPFFRSYVPFPHSVVTVHLIDAAGQPTIAARDGIIDTLIAHLHGQTTADERR